jgi:hypothetical protein
METLLRICVHWQVQFKEFWQQLQIHPQFSLLSLFWKSKSRLMSVFLYHRTLNKFWMPELLFMELGMHIVASELFSMVYFISPSHLSVYPSVFAMQGLSQNVTAAMNTHNNRRIVGRTIFCVVHISKESRRLVLPRTSCLLFDRSSGPSHVENDFCTFLWIAQSVCWQAMGWMARVRFPAGARDFSLLYSVQTGSWVPPSLLYNGYQG